MQRLWEWKGVCSGSQGSEGFPEAFEFSRLSRVSGARGRAREAHFGAHSLGTYWGGAVALPRRRERTWAGAPAGSRVLSPSASSSIEGRGRKRPRRRLRSFAQSRSSGSVAYSAGAASLSDSRPAKPEPSGADSGTKFSL